MIKIDQKISVVITVLNEATTVNALLVALQKQQLQPAEVIIVDGGSTDETLQILNNFKDLSLRVFQKNGNRSVGRNEAFKQAQHELIAITDAGCIPDPDWLLELTKTFKDMSVVAGYYDAEPKNSFQSAVIPYALVMPDRLDPNNFLPATRSMLLPKSIWKQLGGFNELLPDNEDYEFAHKIKRAKVPIIFTSAAKVLWLPPSTFTQFVEMIFRFARGDAFAGIWRPKVLFIFARYLLGLTSVIAMLQLTNERNAMILFLISLAAYLTWAVQKNVRYVPDGWYWLPLLQLGADMGVMLGSIQGLLLNLLRSLDQHTPKSDHQK